MNKIDVIIPAYNCSKTLPRTLGSLLAQTNSNFNIILVDDCSTEDLTPIVEQFNMLNIQHVRKERNEGCGMARQTGIDSSTAPYFTFVDADDILMPYTIDLFYQGIEQHSEIDYFMGFFYEQSPNGRDLQLIKDGWTWCHGKLYKREFIEKYNIRNDITVKYADDSFFNSMVTEFATLSIIQRPLYIWTYTPTSITRKKDSEFRKTVESDFIFAMIKSLKFSLQYKKPKDIKFSKSTFNLITQKVQAISSLLSKEEKQKIQIGIFEFKRLAQL